MNNFFSLSMREKKQKGVIAFFGEFLRDTKM